VTARHRTDAVGHTDQCKTKGKADTCKADACGSVSARDNSRAAAEQDKCECADEFG